MAANPYSQVAKDIAGYSDRTLAMMLPPSLLTRPKRHGEEPVHGGLVLVRNSDEWCKMFVGMTRNQHALGTNFRLLAAALKPRFDMILTWERLCDWQRIEPWQIASRPEIAEAKIIERATDDVDACDVVLMRDDLEALAA